MSSTITYSYCSIIGSVVKIEKTKQWFNIYHSVPDGIQDLLENHEEFLLGDHNVILVHDNRRVYLDVGGSCIYVDDDMLTIKQYGDKS